jgi:hypothetical protein
MKNRWIFSLVLFSWLLCVVCGWAAEPFVPAGLLDLVKSSLRKDQDALKIIGSTQSVEENLKAIQAVTQDLCGTIPVTLVSKIGKIEAYYHDVSVAIASELQTAQKNLKMAQAANERVSTTYSKEKIIGACNAAEEAFVDQLNLIPGTLKIRDKSGGIKTSLISSDVVVKQITTNLVETSPFDVTFNFGIDTGKIEAIKRQAASVEKTTVGKVEDKAQKKEATIKNKIKELVLPCTFNFYDSECAMYLDLMIKLLKDIKSEEPALKDSTVELDGAKVLYDGSKIKTPILNVSKAVFPDVLIAAWSAGGAWEARGKALASALLAFEKIKKIFSNF